MLQENQVRVVEIAQSLAQHSIAFHPFDSQGREIDTCPSTEDTRVVFQFVHRATGHLVQSIATGFGKSCRIVVSDITPDYSFSAVGGYGSGLNRPLHLYLYSRRNGIRADLTLANSATQLARREVVAYPNLEVGSAFLIPIVGTLAYNPTDAAATAPLSLPKVFGLFPPNLITVVKPGVAQEIFVLGDADTALDLSSAANARSPDLPVFCFKLSTSGSFDATNDARDNYVFTSPIFTGNADAAQSFFSVDTVAARFDRMDVPSAGQIIIGSNPIFDATAWVKDSQFPDFLQLRAQHFMAADNRVDINYTQRIVDQP